MQLRSFLDGRVVCVDKLLTEPAFRAVQRLAAAARYRAAETQDPNRIWDRNTYDNPDIASTIVWPELERHRELLAAVPEFKLYPTGDALDQPLSVIREVAMLLDVVGSRGTDWAAIVASIFRYNNDGGLIFHTDAISYSGAFSFYLHEDWHPDWGGSFMFSSCAPASIDHGLFLVPKPNRLVLLRAGTPHTVAGVAAPEGVSRIALSGFFVRGERAEPLLQEYLSRAARR
jgi:hypothetical protein